MKIAIISYEFPPHNGIGGIAYYSYNLAKLLSNEHTIYVFSGSDQISSSYVSDSSHGFYSVIVKSDNGSDFIKKVLDPFTEIHEKINFELIESPEVGACALEVKRKFSSIPLVVKLHTPVSFLGKIYIDNTSSKVRLKWLFKSLISGRRNLFKEFFTRSKAEDPEFKLIKLAELITSPSQELIDALNSFWKEELNAEIIDNFYPIHKTDEQILENKILSISRNINICFVGKITFLKGADMLFKILKKLHQSDICFHIDIVGDDHGDDLGMLYKIKYKHVIKSMKNKITFHSRLNNESVLKIIKESHVMIITSLWENQATVIWEAIANNSLVLTRPVGGIRSMIIDKENGYFFNSIDQCISILKEIQNDKIKYESLLSNANQTLRARMDINTSLIRQNEVYKIAISNAKINLKDRLN